MKILARNRMFGFFTPGYSSFFLPFSKTVPSFGRVSRFSHRLESEGINVYNIFMQCFLQLVYVNGLIIYKAQYYSLISASKNLLKNQFTIFFMNFAKHFAISVCPATQRANLFPRAHPKPKVKALLISKINTTLKVTI